MSKNKKPQQEKTGLKDLVLSNFPASEKEPKKAQKAFNRIRGVESHLPASPGEWKGEGVDHVCIDRKSTSSLGRVLSTAFESNWTHPVLGYFRSMENLWLFLSVATPHDSLRSMFRKEARQFAINKLGGLSYYPNTEAMLLDSIYRMVKSRRNTVEELRKSKLPFDIYYVNPAGIRVRNHTYLWMLGGYEEIRNAIKEDREPDFTPWITHTEQHIYHDIMVALGVAAEKTEELFKKAIDAHGQKADKVASRPEKKASVVKERQIQSIDPAPGFVVKVRVDPGKKEQVSETVTGELAVHSTESEANPGEMAQNPLSQGDLDRDPEAVATDSLPDVQSKDQDKEVRLKMYKTISVRQVSEAEKPEMLETVTQTEFVNTNPEFQDNGSVGESGEAVQLATSTSQEVSFVSGDGEVEASSVEVVTFETPASSDAAQESADTAKVPTVSPES